MHYHPPGYCNKRLEEAPERLNASGVRTSGQRCDRLYDALEPVRLMIRLEKGGSWLVQHRLLQHRLLFA